MQLPDQPHFLFRSALAKEKLHCGRDFCKRHFREKFNKKHVCIVVIHHWKSEKNQQEMFYGFLCVSSSPTESKDLMFPAAKPYGWPTVQQIQTHNAQTDADINTVHSRTNCVSGKWQPLCLCWTYNPDWRTERKRNMNNNKKRRRGKR